MFTCLKNLNFLKETEIEKRISTFLYDIKQIKKEVFTLEDNIMKEKRATYRQQCKDVFLVQPFETKEGQAFVNTNWSLDILNQYAAFLKRIPFSLNRLIDLFLEL